MRFEPRFRRFAVALAAALATLALAAPVAPAVPVEQFLGPHSAQIEQAPASHGTDAPHDISTDPGFNWGAAAIGAGTAIGLMALAAMTGFVLTGRGRIRIAR